MLLTTIFEPDRSRFGSFLASLWQGERPAGIVVQRWLYLGQPTEKMLLVWEAADASEQAWLEARMAPFGTVHTWLTSDTTSGMVAALDRDLDGFAAVLRTRGATDEAIAVQLEVRRRGFEAESLAEAEAAGAAWSAEHPSR